MPGNNQVEQQRAAAVRVEAAVLAALKGAPKLTREQANNIVGLLLVNSESPKAAWVEETPPGGGD